MFITEEPDCILFLLDEPTPNRLYPDLESLNAPTQPLIPVYTGDIEIISPSTMDNIPTDSTTTDNILTDPTMNNILTPPCTMDTILMAPCTMDTILTDTSNTGLQDTTGSVEQECLTVLAENKFKLPELPSQQKQRIDIPSGRDREEFNEEVNQSGTALEERVLSPVEAADSLTQQWMEYAKEQGSIWKSSIEVCDKDKV